MNTIESRNFGAGIDNAIYCIQRAEIYRERGDHDQAENFLKGARFLIRIQPVRETADAVHYAELANKTGDSALSEMMLRRADNLIFYGEDASKLADAWVRLGNTDKAIAVLENAVEEGQNLRLKTSRLYRSKGDHNMADHYQNLARQKIGRIK